MSKTKLLIVVCCVIISVAFSFWLYIKQGKKLSEQVKDYTASEATIIQVSPARMSRYGIKTPRYGISFAATDNKIYVHYNCELKGNFKINDRVTIYYNPKNPKDPVVDRK